VLFHFADSLPINGSQPLGLPRLTSRKVGDNKRRLDVELEDVYNLLFQLDQLKVVLPRFVALNLSRIPAINPSEADVLCAGN